jgi:malate dehydrogenase
MKVSIVGGAGVVGSSAAYRIAQSGLASEIILVDAHRNLAEAHSLDIEQGVVHRATTRVYQGEIGDTQNSDVIIMAASSPRRSSLSSRVEYLSQNLPLVIGLAESLSNQSPSAIWIIATVPVDPLVYLIHQTFSLPRQKVMGVNRNDTSRFRWAIAKTLSFPSTSVEAFVLGEHGETQVPIFSRIRIYGEKVSLNPGQIEQIQNKITDFFPYWIKLKSGRSAGWTTAESIGDIFESIVTDDQQIWTCSTPLEGEYGLSGVSLGVPIQINPEGVKTIIEFDLEPGEKHALEASASAVKKQIKEGQVLLSKSHTSQDS